MEEDRSGGVCFGWREFGVATVRTVNMNRIQYFYLYKVKIPYYIPYIEYYVIYFQTYTIRYGWN